MILECPLCSTRYLVHIGLFAQGGRRVRCANCKHEWQFKLPTSVDVVLSSPEFPEVSSTLTPPSTPSSPPLSSRPPPLSRPPDAPYKPTPNLPAVIKKKLSPEWLLFFSVLTFLAAVFILASVLGRSFIVKAVPSLRGSYNAVGLKVLPEWDGLIFDEVKSELKYDSGTMKLYVDGSVRNATDKKKRVPDIKARALGADKKVIQSWWIDAPAATIDAWGRVPFHTEVATPMERTIEDVYLEFTSRKDDGNAD
ncbi:MAG: zinc-ribbon domain-containing protein [Bdellovibrionales bacterium]|jgi:predicted Zn finger-like uncharacterized protein